MRKGDARREQIMATAETLFYQKGYEQTSVQDILDALQFSKGGFYHHFESKLALLSAICEQRAQESYEAAQAAVAACAGDPVAQLNALTDSGGLWRTDRLDYIGLLLRVAYRGGRRADARTPQAEHAGADAAADERRDCGGRGKRRVCAAPRFAGRGAGAALTAQFTDEVALRWRAAGTKANS